MEKLEEKTRTRKRCWAEKGVEKGMKTDSYF